MKKELIFKLAKDAGLFTHKEVQPEIEAFAKLVSDAEAKRMQDEGMVTIGHMREQVAKKRERVIAAATKLAESKANELIALEREACAMVCEELPAPDIYNDSDKSMWDVTTMDCAEAIRARSNT
jgi:hypothetical protein